MPMNRKLYPENWEKISHHIRFERAGGRCERCGVKHGAIGARALNGEWYDEEVIFCMNSDQGYELFDEYPHIVRIILTTAHLNQDPSDNREENLAALCQRCHLNHDRPVNVVHAAATRRINRRLRVLATGQLELWGER